MILLHSSPTRTIAGLSSFKENVILIAGGYDKKLPFEELAVKGIDKIKVLVLIGNTKAKIRSAFEQEMKKRNIELVIDEADSLEEAVKIAKDNAITGDVITMSPACASFDMYKNFEIRGIAFKDIVNKLEMKEQRRNLQWKKKEKEKPFHQDLQYFLQL